MKMNKNKRKVKDTRAQEHKITKTQEHKITKTQEHKSTRPQEHKSTREKIHMIILVEGQILITIICLTMNQVY